MHAPDDDHAEQVARRPPLEAVVALLGACDLPVADLAPAALDHFFGAGDGALRGVVGLELHGDVGLLRSLAVRADARGRGLGRRLVARAEADAAGRGVAALYLLTTTAESFFRRLGYARIERDAVPAAIRSSAEFARLCPSTAVVMAKKLQR